MLTGLDLDSDPPCVGLSACPYDQAVALENNPLIGDVEFNTKISNGGGGTKSGIITFSNITDSETDQTYADWTWETSVAAGFGTGPGSVPPASDDGDHPSGEDEYYSFSFFGEDGNLQGTFYGPSFEEIGGIFRRSITHDEYTHMMGAFGAKRQ